MERLIIRRHRGWRVWFRNSATAPFASREASLEAAVHWAIHAARQGRSVEVIVQRGEKRAVAWSCGPRRQTGGVDRKERIGLAGSAPVAGSHPPLLSSFV